MKHFKNYWTWKSVQNVLFQYDFKTLVQVMIITTTTTIISLLSRFVNFGDKGRSPTKPKLASTHDPTNCVGFGLKLNESLFCLGIGTTKRRGSPDMITASSDVTAGPSR